MIIVRPAASFAELRLGLTPRRIDRDAAPEAMRNACCGDQWTACECSPPGSEIELIA
jgi:hypothetical protein